MITDNLLWSIVVLIIVVILIIVLLKFLFAVIFVLPYANAHEDVKAITTAGEVFRSIW
jgi:uncharacterized membrane protein